jgi:hypothetical protein
MNATTQSFDLAFNQGEYKHFIRLYRHADKFSMNLFLDGGEPAGGDSFDAMTCVPVEGTPGAWLVQEFTDGRTKTLQAENEAEAIATFMDFALAWIESHGPGINDPFDK